MTLEEIISNIPSEIRNNLIPYHTGQPILGRITLNELIKLTYNTGIKAALDELPDIKNHICGFNDKECRCDSYHQAIFEAKEAITELIK